MNALLARRLKNPYIKFLFCVAVVLILVRVGMPFAIKKYVLYKIDQIPEYHAELDSLNMSIIRGSYTIHDFKLVKQNKNRTVPFFSAKKIDLAVDWKALFHLAFVAKVYVDTPQLNFIVEPSGKNQQLTIDDQWQVIAKALFPLNFNRFAVKDGSIHLRSFTSKPSFDIFLKNIQAKLDNAQGVIRSKNTLSSHLKINGTSMNKAPFNIDVQMDPFAKTPTFKLKGEMKEMNIKEINPFLQHYTKIKVDKGLFSLYVEAAAQKGKIDGYAKPIIKDLQIRDPEKDNAGVIEALYAGALEALSHILENSDKKTIATKVNITGKIDDPNTSVLSIVGYLLRHAFIQALLPKIDNSIQMQDVIWS